MIGTLTVLMLAVLVGAISIETLVMVVFGLIVGGLIMGLLWFAINYVAAKYPSPFWDFVRVVVVLLAVFVLICVLLGLAGRPIVKW